MRLETEADTEAFGRALGEAAEAGDVIALSGDLGAGKSVLARGVARGLGLTCRIPSPTFLIVAHYAEGRLPFAHADLYRPTDRGELEQLGLDELIGRDGVAVVEWAERFADELPPDRLTIELIVDGEARRARLVAAGPRSARLLAAIGGRGG